MPGGWTIDIQGVNGGANIVTDAPFKAARPIWTVEGPGSIEIDLTEAQLSTDWQPGTHRVILNGPKSWAGYITGLSQTGRLSQEGKTWTVRGLGLAYILDWRIVRHQIVLTDYLVSDIVEWLLDEAQTQYNGDMGFTMGSINGGPTITRTRDYCFGVVIGDAIRELASIGRGFDWAIDASGNLNIWDDTRGVDTAITYDPEAQNTVDYTVDIDTSQLLTTVSAIGEQGDPFGPRHDMVRDVNGATTFGRHEIAIDVPSEDRDDLLDAAKAELKVGKGGLVTLNATWVDGDGPWDWGDVGLQDIVSVVLPSYFGGTQDMRCIDISISLEPEPANARYFITYSFDGLLTESEINDVDPDE